jgi:hypothetical protein
VGDFLVAHLDAGGTLAWTTMSGGGQEDTAGGLAEHSGIGHPIVAKPDGGLLVVGATKVGAGDWRPKLPLLDHRVVLDPTASA